MTAVLQRVKNAAVRVDGKTVGSCDAGLMILLGVRQGDDAEDSRLLAEKIARLRIFEDEAGKMNLSVLDIGGSALVVSNFTLAADYSHGNRPSFIEAARPEIAEPLYLDFAARLRALVGRVECGEFGADMKIEMTADGPVTIVMESDKLRKGKRGI